MTAMRALVIFMGALSILQAQTDWPVYGHDPGGMRYSPLKKINAKNVAKLQVAWTFDTQAPLTPAAVARGSGVPTEAAPLPGRGRGRGGAQPRRRLSESTPLVISGVMYLSTAYNRIVALEPETGNKLWEY